MPAMMSATINKARRTYLFAANHDCEGAVEAKNKVEVSSSGGFCSMVLSAGILGDEFGSEAGATLSEVMASSVREIECVVLPPVEAAAPIASLATTGSESTAAAAAGVFAVKELCAI